MVFSNAISAIHNSRGRYNTTGQWQWQWRSPRWLILLLVTLNPEPCVQITRYTTHVCRGENARGSDVESADAKRLQRQRHCVSIAASQRQRSLAKGRPHGGTIGEIRRSVSVAASASQHQRRWILGEGSRRNLEVKCRDRQRQRRRFSVSCKGESARVNDGGNTSQRQRRSVSATTSASQPSSASRVKPPPPPLNVL